MVSSYNLDVGKNIKLLQNYQNQCWCCVFVYLLIDALLSEVLNVQSELSEEPPFTIWSSG